MLFISDAYAEPTPNLATTASTKVATGANAPVNESPFMNLLPMVVIFAVFYFFLIRPQQKKVKEHEDFLKTIKAGDEVVTSGGIIGKVSKVEENSNLIHLEIAKDVVVRLNRIAIADVVSEENSGKSSEKDKKDKKKATA